MRFSYIEQYKDLLDAPVRVRINWGEYAGGNKAIELYAQSIRQAEEEVVGDREGEVAVYAGYVWLPHDLMGMGAGGCEYECGKGL